MNADEHRSGQRLISRRARRVLRELQIYFGPPGGASFNLQTLYLILSVTAVSLWWISPCPCKPVVEFGSNGAGGCQGKAQDDAVFRVAIVRFI